MYAAKKNDMGHHHTSCLYHALVVIHVANKNMGLVMDHKKDWVAPLLAHAYTPMPIVIIFIYLY